MSETSNTGPSQPRGYVRLWYSLDAARRSGFADFVSYIHFVGGEKGGVGKSVVARVLVQWFIDRSIPFAAVDADTSHNTLLRAYGNHTQAVDLDVFDSADEIMNRALAADRRVVVDMPAQSIRAFERWAESADLVRFARETGIRMTLWHVTDGSYDSVRDLERTIHRFGEQFAYIVVRNHGRSGDFGLLEESEGRRRLEQLGGRFVDWPELEGAAMQRIDRASSSFSGAVNTTDGDTALSAMQRQRTRRWLDKCYQVLGGLGDAL